MYWNVPMMVPSAVSWLSTVVGDCVRRTPCSMTPLPERPATARGRARDQVHQLGAAAREHDVAGLQVAVHDASAGGRDRVHRQSPRPVSAHPEVGSGPRKSRCASVSPFDELHHEIVGIAFATDVVQGADVRDD
jgi:hypothetical protein